jgi:hypothetical protein
VGILLPEQPIDSDRKAKSLRSRQGRTMYVPSCEEAIWQSEMGRKGVAGDMGAPHVTRHVYSLPIFILRTYP